MLSTPPLSTRQSRQSDRAPAVLPPPRPQKEPGFVSDQLELQTRPLPPLAPDFQTHLPTLARPPNAPLFEPGSVLRDLPGDLTPVKALAHINRLRNQAQRGVDTSREDFFHYSALSHDNSLKLYTDREYFTDGLFPAIDRATDSIHLAFLTIDGGQVAQYVTDKLIAKKENHPNIEIRILTDGLGASAIFPWSKASRNIRRLRRAGIPVVVNNVLFDGLEHRKLLVVDGKEAYSGGTCLGDPYFGNRAFWRTFNQIPANKRDTARDALFDRTLPPPFEITPELELPEFHDYGIRYTGSSVADLQAAFMQSWLQHGQTLNPDLTNEAFAKRYFPHPDPIPENEATTLKMVHSAPAGESQFRQSALAVIDGATQTLDINFTYILIPEFLERVEAAAARGVKVRMLMPGKEGIDLEICWWITRSYYPQLSRAGDVEFYEFNTYTHCKFLVADKRLVFASTGNPEWQSWEWACDSSVLIDSPAFAAEVETTIFDKDMGADRAILVPEQEIHSPRWWEKVIQFFSNLINWIFQSPRLPRHPRRKLISPLS